MDATRHPPYTIRGSQMERPEAVLATPSPGLTITCEVTALANSMGESAQILDEQSVNSGSARSTAALLHDLVGAMRDNVFLEPATVDELLDMQPSNEHAKALLVALGVHELLPVHETVETMRERGLGGF